FWFRISNPTIESSNKPPVKVEVPSELPKVSLVNASLKKLKFYLAQFDYVGKKRTTPDARTEDLLNEIMKVQTIFDQIDTVVQQSSVDKQCLEIAKKELLLENDQFLQQIMSQDVLLTMMNSMSLNGESVNMERKRNESCDKCFNLDAELLKSQNAHNELLKKFFENNNLKAKLQDKDTTICKLKEIIKSMREKSKEENVNYDYCEIETQNVELENSVAKLLLENEHLCKEINHEQADILRGIVKQAKAKQPLDNALDFTSKVVPPKKTTSYSVETQKPELKVYSRKPKNVKNVGSSKKAKIVESKNANHSEPNHTWGSNATDIPSSSSLVMTGCPDCSLVSGLRMFETYDREPLSAHELC
ncbi:hypothetical protein Tco_0773418, partial [Tanacetum coccineum]